MEVMSRQAVAESVRHDLELHLRQTAWQWTVGSVAPLMLGHSGFTYIVEADDGRRARRCVLRLPPPGARPMGPADVARQGRIVAALHGLGLPVPAVVAQSAQGVVDGRPFVLFEMVEGLRIEELSDHVPAAQLGAGAVQTLRRLHEIPIEMTGLRGEEPVSLSNELARWAGLFERSRTELSTPHEGLREALASSVPAPHTACLVHGDYHYGNFLFTPDGAILAVLDWEIAELGQPLVDLGSLAIVGMSRGAGVGGPIPGPILASEELASLYGAPEEEFDWYRAFSCYKYAAIYSYNLMLHRRGKRIDPFNEGLEPLIVHLLEQGLALFGEGADL